ncbi:MAG: carbohydrate kinase family protein [Chloroflexi bacterium]|nr:carbohydrate kinase family protein [Chloroflexota bacterium]
MGEHILVIGASLLDTKGKPIAGLEPGTSNPAYIRSTRGGTARNVAENLARLGATVVLVSAVGEDNTGQRLLESTAAAGVDTTHVQIIAGARTGGYIVLLDEQGKLMVALDDTAVMSHVSADYLRQHENLFAAADMLMLDGGVTAEAFAVAIELARKHKVPICADPSSARLAGKLIPYLPYLDLVVPNEVEAAELCHTEFTGYDPEKSLLLARQLMQKGVQQVVITLSDFGLVYVTSEESGYLPAHYTEMIDSTGTGDAITAAIMFGLLNGLDTAECMRLGTAAASLTLQIGETVVPDLSLDMLYEHLL